MLSNTISIFQSLAVNVQCVCVSVRVYRSEFENRKQTHGKLKWYIA